MTRELVSLNQNKNNFNMKKLLLFTCLASFFSLNSNAQIWIEQNSNLPNVSEGIRDIYPVNDDVVWIIGYDGSGGGANFIDFGVSSDGGNNFTTGTVGSDTTFQFSNITAVSADTAWVAMFDQIAQQGGGIWRTTDGGANWVQQGAGLIYDSLSFPDVVHFWNSNEGVTIGDPNNGYFEIYTTVDGGDNWTRVPTGNIPNELSGEAGITDWYDVVGDNVWFWTNKGRLFHSIDKGYNWTVSSIMNLPATSAMSVRFFDDMNGFAQSYESATGAFVNARKTSNGGANWTVINPVGMVYSSDMAVIPNTGVIVSTGAAQGFSGSGFSLDSGLTWVDIDGGIQHTALGAASYNGLWSGGFVGAGPIGGIFKWDGYNMGVADNKIDLHAYSLYPNPSNGLINLNFKSRAGSTIQVTDAMGRIAYSQQLSAISGAKSFDFSALSKGVYSLTVFNSNDVLIQEKLVIQ
jgi:photosystem II stability/assembly factor-like uncharacterized protein